MKQQSANPIKWAEILTLLDDSSDEVKRMVKNEILEHALQIVLSKQTILEHIPQLHKRPLIQFLENLHNELVTSAFRQACQRGLEDLDLEKSVLLVSFWNEPSVSCIKVTSQLDELAAEIKSQMPLIGHPLSFLDHLNYFIFKKFGFEGNSEDYYNPDNYFVHKVVETRKGIPLTLAIVYILIAQRLEIPIYGVSMPAHFILRFDNGEDEIFFDPFYKGKIYSRRECEAYLEYLNYPNPQNTLQGSSNYEMILRLLRNLHLIYSSYTEAPEKIKQIKSFMGILESHYLIET